MKQEILLGVGFAFAAGLQPGPLQAFLLSRVATVGWRRTLPAAFAPLLGDGPAALLVLFVIGRLSAPVQQALRVAGGVLLLWLAWGVVRQWRSPRETASAQTGQCRGPLPRRCSPTSSTPERERLSRAPAARPCPPTA